MAVHMRLKSKRYTLVLKLFTASTVAVSGWLFGLGVYTAGKTVFLDNVSVNSEPLTVTVEKHAARDSISAVAKITIPSLEWDVVVFANEEPLSNTAAFTTVNDNIFTNGLSREVITLPADEFSALVNKLNAGDEILIQRSNNLSAYFRVQKTQLSDEKAVNPLNFQLHFKSVESQNYKTSSKEKFFNVILKESVHNYI